jgi:hypothetical protein
VHFQALLSKWSSKTPQKQIEKILVEKSCVVFSYFFIAFLDISLHGEFKNTKKRFVGKNTKNLTQKRYTPTYLYVGVGDSVFFYMMALSTKHVAPAGSCPLAYGTCLAFVCVVV